MFFPNELYGYIMTHNIETVHIITSIMYCNKLNRHITMHVKTVYILLHQVQNDA